jgi:hypothetical protein
VIITFDDASRQPRCCSENRGVVAGVICRAADFFQGAMDFSFALVRQFTGDTAL